MSLFSLLDHMYYVLHKSFFMYFTSEFREIISYYICQVWSLDPGSGSLNVSITGPRPHTVTETSVLYTGDNLYEVTYEVTQPGFYKIFVKWADVNLPSSPYIAEITF